MKRAALHEVAFQAVVRRVSGTFYFCTSGATFFPAMSPVRRPSRHSASSAETIVSILFTNSSRYFESCGSFSDRISYRSFTHFKRSPAEAKLTYFVLNRKEVLRPVATVVITAGNTIAHFGKPSIAAAKAVRPAARMTAVCKTLSRIRWVVF